jgi:hypothetical protein
MTTPIAEDVIQSLRAELDRHPLYAAIQGVDDCAPSWSTMSIRCGTSCRWPSTCRPWWPRPAAPGYRWGMAVCAASSTRWCWGGMRRDHAGTDGGYTSHFELYCQAMEEIGADTGPVLAFVDVRAPQGVEAALALPGCRPPRAPSPPPPSAS